MFFTLVLVNFIRMILAILIFGDWCYLIFYCFLDTIYEVNSTLILQLPIRARLLLRLLLNPFWFKLYLDSINHWLFWLFFPVRQSRHVVFFRFMLFWLHFSWEFSIFTWEMLFIFLLIFYFVWLLSFHRPAIIYLVFIVVVLDIWVIFGNFQWRHLRL